VVAENKSTRIEMHAMLKTRVLLSARVMEKQIFIHMAAYMCLGLVLQDALLK
jgi:hypothetical protein